MGEKAVSTYTYEAYLALEAESDIKYEYHDGFIVAMAGGTPEHSRIASNMGWALQDVLRKQNSNCSTFNSDLKIRIESSRRTFYPDAAVICGKSIISEKDKNAVTNPILVVEVLSEGTAEFDRGAKFTHYRQIPGFREYVLISQTEATVDTFYRTEDDTWEIRTTSGLDNQLVLKSIDAKIEMADIYRRVENINPNPQ